MIWILNPVCAGLSAHLQRRCQQIAKINVIDLLLNAGADVTIKDKKGKDVFARDYSHSRDNMLIYDYLREFQKKNETK